MALTPNTTSTPYITASDLFRFVDWRVIADLVSDDDTAPRPTRAALADAGTDEGAVVVEHLLAASGELETACLAGGRYDPEDIQAMSGAGLRYLKRLVASLTFWSLAQKREPASADPDKVAGAGATLAVLEQLRKGERILPFAETQAAGGGPTTTPNYDCATEPGGSRTVAQASRLFGNPRDCCGS